MALILVWTHDEYPDSADHSASVVVGTDGQAHVGDPQIGCAEPSLPGHVCHGFDSVVKARSLGTIHQDHSFDETQKA